MITAVLAVSVLECNSPLAQSDRACLAPVMESDSKKLRALHHTSLNVINWHRLTLRMTEARQ